MRSPKLEEPFGMAKAFCSVGTSCFQTQAWLKQAAQSAKVASED